MKDGEKERDRKRGRQTDRQTDRQADRGSNTKRVERARVIERQRLTRKGTEAEPEREREDRLIHGRQTL